MDPSTPDNRGGTIHDASDLGTVASHAPRATQPFLVSPTHASDFNVLALDLIPVACLGLHDVLFEFDSSFVTPPIGHILDQLPDLRERHKNKNNELPPVSVFGHADPVGSDDYNKKLSGRRARAVQGLLLHDPSIWQPLYDTPLPLDGDNWKKHKVIDEMRAALDDEHQPASDSFSDVAQAYMDAICTARLKPGDFLGKGGGKADAQGCSEFNPLVILSESDSRNLPTRVRNQKNAVNRRVVVYLFRAGTKINPSLWPCPKPEDGPVGCRARFFANGDQRRKAGAEQREFAKTSDTWACRFYDRIAGNSPCERPVPPSRSHISLLLRSNSGCVPLANRPYKIHLPDEVIEGTTDDDGLVAHEDVQPGDYKLEIDGHETFIPTLPKKVTRCLHQVEDYFLFPDES